jgi:hypothetical protein
MTTTFQNISPSGVIESLLNGNLTRAQEDASLFSLKALIEEAMGMGYNYNDALIMGSFLTGQISFQDYADNFNNKK